MNKEKVKQTELFSIKPFSKQYQEQTKELILEGLREYIGELNVNFNEDLNDIEENYKDQLFLIALYKGEVIATGALLYSSQNPQIVRMSVKKKYRELGIGRNILDTLIKDAQSKKYRRVILETTKNWRKAINFYRNYGFEIAYYLDSDVYFYLDI